jgi:hypothetical protein
MTDLERFTVCLEQMGFSEVVQNKYTLAAFEYSRRHLDERTCHVYLGGNGYSGFFADFQFVDGELVDHGSWE